MQLALTDSERALRAGAPSPRARSTCLNSRKLINSSWRSRLDSKRLDATTGTCEHVSGEGKPRRSRGGLGHQYQHHYRIFVGSRQIAQVTRSEHAGALVGEWT